MRTAIIYIYFFIFCFMFVGCVGVAQAEKDKKDKYLNIEIENEDSRHGVYDPSLEYDEKGIGWMSYSAIEIPKKVSTKIAKSTDYGKTWKYIQTVNQSTEGSVNYKGEKLSGEWRYEVSSLVRDPKDPGKEWKLFSHKYFVKEPYGDNDRVFPYGWISYKYSSDPAGKWSDEIALFGAKGFPPSPYKTKINLSKLHPDLNEYQYYSELGTLQYNGVLYISMETSQSLSGMGKWESRKTILLSSSDHGNNWKYVGTLTFFKDAKKLGYITLTGSSMFEQNGKAYYMITPSGPLKGPGKHENGVFIFEFEDIKKAKLKRDVKGDLIVFKHISPPVTDSNRGGQGDYDKMNINGGVVMSHFKEPTILKILFGKKIFTIFSMNEMADR